MKSLIMLLLVVLAGVTASGQTTKKTQTLKVSGNCNMCEERIEKAALAQGALDPSWDVKTKLLTFSYEPAKTSPDAVAKKVASVGHDAGKFKAEDKVYNALPSCCKYDRSGSAKAETESHTHTH
ncbi:MAG TPA: ATPase [Bacteroidales bacterium]|nr:ATPase [Bacteroidales bacterium]